MIAREKIIDFLEETFGISTAVDCSFNGLQFEGGKQIRKIATGVDATKCFFQAAGEAGANFAIVHHGIFWKGKEWRRIDRFMRDIISSLDKADLNLYAIHLPLDSHPKFGNNFLLAKAVGITIEEQFGEFMNQKIGFAGRLARPQTIEAFKKTVETKIGPITAHLNFGKPQIKTVGIVSGGGWDTITDRQVSQGRIDVLLTGDVLHQAAAPCKDRGIHLIAAGHYATETFGVKALGEFISKKFKIPHVFIDQPTGL